MARRRTAILRGHRVTALALVSVVAASVGGCDDSRESTAAAGISVSAEPAQRGARRKQSDKFSNIELVTQHGESVRFYDDLLADRAVMINLMYTTCETICPANSARLAEIHRMLGPRMGQDITLISISIDPEVDTPARLKRYWEVFGAKPGWLFLTGDYDEIDRLRHELGVYDLDPVVDADKTQHSGVITIGNDRTDRWTALPVLMHPQQLAKTILDTTRDERWQAATDSVRRDANALSAVANGIVREVDVAARAIVIEHEDIPGLMLAMTMRFDVAESVRLDTRSIGRTVEFGVELRGDHPVVTSLAEPTDDPARIDAARNYATYCAACHGARGAGDGPLAGLLETRPARHDDPAALGTLTDAELYRVIRDGGPAIGKSAQMGAWRDILSDTQIQALVTYLHVLADESARSAE